MRNEYFTNDSSLVIAIQRLKPILSRNFAFFYTQNEIIKQSKIVVQKNIQYF